MDDRDTYYNDWLPENSDDLRDADKREQFLAETVLAVARGEIKTADANCIRALCKELRENTDIRMLVREVVVCRELFREVLRRKGRITKHEIEQIFIRAYQSMQEFEDSDIKPFT